MTMRSARLDEPKVCLGLSSETDSRPQDWLALAEQEIDHSRSERGKLERHPIRDRSCDVLRGFQIPGRGWGDTPCGESESENCGGGAVPDELLGAKYVSEEGASALGLRPVVVYPM